MQHFIATFGFLAVFVLMAAESACIPVPSELIMLFGGALAAGAVPGSHPSLALVIAAGVLGNLAGSYFAWAVGRSGGQAALRRWGRYIWLKDEDIDRATDWFERYGTKAVLVGRMLPVVRTFISLPAGIAAMAPVRFGLYTVAGCIPWTAALGVAGYAVGGNWHSIADDFHGPTYAIAAIIALLGTGGLIALARKRRAEQAAATLLHDGSEPQPAGRPRGQHARR
ncbi:DedA family protein [Streptomyces sp. TRM68367]|uniref:DedA family protein n=1 Tax=Streptomyces sp. TRM68367 TaxID=2758415 RepID=UPI00165AAC3D|nr:DedA family protein [Streptomyces sp. TRM68367]MBC9727512.1 DedA family protein [Streptomyces sp. TRM68367]